MVYNEIMARGWESKAVEEQQNAAEAKEDARAKRESSAFERERRARRDGLLMDRARIMRELEAARNPRYRGLLERSLAHVDDELAQLDSDPPPA
jgi:hypothetical protein